MKDLISKVTFGFLMAQFVPGAIVTYSLSLLYVAMIGDSPQELESVASHALDMWMQPVSQFVVFVVLSTGAGMAVHGLHWAVLGFLESYYAKRDDDKIVKLHPVYKTFWHRWPPIIQILVGPVKMLAEITLFLWFGRRLDEVSIEENVGSIPKDKMEAFSFLQDFYLHFSQFYAHVSYALLLLFSTLLVAIFAQPGLRFSLQCAMALSILWLASGFFFLISRIQFASLFKAEAALCNNMASKQKRSDIDVGHGEDPKRW